MVEYKIAKLWNTIFHRAGSCEFAWIIVFCRLLCDFSKYPWERRHFFDDGLLKQIKRCRFCSGCINL